MKNYWTNRKYVSFSEFKVWSECSWRHRLLYVQGLKIFGHNIYTDYGSLVHDVSEIYLRTRVMDIDGAVQSLRAIWKKRGYPTVPEWPDYAPSDFSYWEENLRATLEAIPTFMDENFPGWEFVDAESELDEPIVDELIDDQKLRFKGYVDVIIRVKNKSGKWIYWILDWKTTSKRGWDRLKLFNKFVIMQVVLYKFFWSTKHNVPIEDIRCGYVLLRRDVTKNRIKFLDVSAGPKMIEKSRKWLRSMIKMVSEGRALKNRYACTYCEFKDTEYCKLDL